MDHDLRRRRERHYPPLTLPSPRLPTKLYWRALGFDAHARPGGTLDLGSESGQRSTLRESSFQGVLEMSRPEVGEMRICCSAGELHQAGRWASALRSTGPTSASSSSAPSLPTSSVGATRYPPRALSNSNQDEVTFAKGFTSMYDFLVGAPACSRVVALRNLCTLVTQNLRVLGARINGDGRLRTYTCEFYTIASHPAEAKAVLPEHFVCYPGWLLHLLDFCNELEIVTYPRPLWTLLVGRSSIYTPGVTIIDDGAHLMSPSSG
ncbi:hypothetical protein V8D89_010019 [Ganoderma adspersum]